ncbi:MAG TPA: hypothetical protein VLJ44_00780 [Gaiellaceae bacterium]|nr:hypothetical protein [Gaiellaceae bacterium]
MRGSTAARFIVWGATLAALATLVVAATGMTGAYFSDTHQGAITGNIGSIKVTPSGGTGADSTNFTFTNMLPGVPQTATIQYQNTGLDNEDVWLVFNNATALSALNNLGSYGEVHVSNGHALFDSANLNDRSSTCGPFSPSGCWPLPSQIKVGSDIAPGAGGFAKFTFNYAGKLKNPAAEGAPFNLYPIPGQTTVNAADGSGSGLPYELVATQVGQTP